MRTIAEISAHLATVWDRHPYRSVDWMGLEDTMRLILRSQLSDYLKLAYIAEAIGAYTRRGIPSLGASS